MKPTQVKCAVGSLNQLPPWVEISGDVRLTPSYEVKELWDAVAEWVKDLNENITSLETFGPASKYAIDGARGEIEFTWAKGYMEGVACSLTSPGYHALEDATADVMGEAKPYAIGGSLPLVRDLQRGGFDIQMAGYGKMSSYHADNEHCSLSDMGKGFDILVALLNKMEAN